MKRMSLSPFRLLSLFLFTIVVGTDAFAQDVVGVPTAGEKGITISVNELAERAALADSKPKTIRMRDEFHTRRRPLVNPDAPETAQWPPADNTRNDRQESFIEATQAIHSNFLGIDLFSEGLAIPPDSNGDVSSTQVCVVSNGRIKFYNRNTVCATAQTTAATGTVPLASPVFSSDLDAFFASVAPNGTTDPHVRYDRLTNRWFVVAIDLAAASNRCVIAMSSGPTISNLASFTFFFFVYDAISSPPASPAGYIGGFFDYPTLGVDANALYIGGNMFNSAGNTFFGGSLFVVRKSSLTGGGPIVTTAFHLAGTGTAGIYTPQGVDNDDPTATEGYFVGVDAGVFSRLVFRRISTPGATPTMSAGINLTVPTTQSPQPTPALGTPATGLDGLDDRLFAAMIRKNKITGTSSLWTAHSFEVNASGVGSSSGNRNGSRWYQIDNFGTTPTLTQSGTLFDAAATNPRNYWIPSIAMSGQGHAVLGASTSAADQRADCGVAGRYRTDATGTLQPFLFATTSTTAYDQSGAPERWGDYSQVVVDPLDDMTMWTFQEYCNGTNSWGVRAIQLRAPAPAAPTSPGTIGCGTLSAGNRTTAVTLNGTSSSNTEFFDPGAGYTNRLAVTTTGAGASITSVTFVSPTQITFNVVWPVALAGTTQTLTITNPDCQNVTTTYTLPAGCVVVPVRWISFTGKEAGRRIQLTWITDMETDNTGYILEKQDRTGRWVPIRNQPAKGVNGGTYIDFDDNPQAVNYYRLKQMNFDNTYNYSSVIRVDMKSAGKFLIYPNPVKEQLTVEFPPLFTGGILRMISSVGEVVHTRPIAAENKIMVDVERLAAGNYVVEIESPTGEKQRTMVLVQRRDPKP